MPFLAQETFSLPTKDLQSWLFDDIQYDWDEPRYIDAIDPNRNLSARQSRTIIRQLIAGFRSLGLKKGDCVCVNSLNDIYFPIVFHGIVGAGGVFAATNPAYTSYELAHALKIARVKFILTMPEVFPNVLKAATENGIPKKNIIIFNTDKRLSPRDVLQWDDLLSHGEEDWVRFDDIDTSQNTTAALLYSSGTTGLPKAVMLSHYNFAAQHTLVVSANPRPWTARLLYALPLFHAASAPSVFCRPLKEGAKGFVIPKFDLEKWLWATEKYQITDVVIVPPIAVALINSSLKTKYNMKSVRIASGGAAPLDQELQARVQALIGDQAPFTQVLGMTETSCVVTRVPWPEKDTTGSIGRPLLNMDTKLVDDDGNDISQYGVRGELCVRGPLVTQGYFKNPEANARDWDSEGFFHTGDICYIDGETKLYYIVDRKKELIKIRGFQVSPAEIEGVLLAHPDIADCAVIGKPDPRNKDVELPQAYIIRRCPKSGKPSEADVHGYIKEKLVYYKQLTGGVVFTDMIPKSASGKILKRVLKEQSQNKNTSKL